MKSCRIITLCASLVLLQTFHSYGAVTLTGLLQHGTASDGRTAGSPIFNTLGYEVSFANIYVTAPNGGYTAPLLNSGNAANTSISYDLSLGVHTFYFFTMGFWDNNPGQYGLNLFFEGDNTNPGISAYSPANVSGATVVPEGKLTLSLSGDNFNKVPAPGTLTYTANGLNVTLTDYGFGQPGVFGGPAIDRVSNLNSNPDGYADSVARFTVNVTPVPEPTAFALLGLGALTILGMRRRGLLTDRVGGLASPTAALSLLLSFPHLTQAASFTVTDLGALPGDNSSVAGSINSVGEVALLSWTQGSGQASAAVYNSGTLQDIGSLGDYTWPGEINNSGHLVGHSRYAGQSIDRPFLYSGGVMSDLGTLGGSFGHARGINLSGQVVGYAATSNDSTYHAFLYSGGVMQDLGTLGGNVSVANAINDSGQVVGGADFSGSPGFRAFLYDNGEMQDLGTFGGDTSQAWDISSSGQVVGAAELPGNNGFRAFLYSGGVMYDLGSIGGGTSSVARGINASGQVVGYGGPSNHGFLHSDGEIQDLNDLIDPASGWLIGAAYDINDAGQIVGEGYHVSDGYAYKHGYLLTPVPEPSYALSGLLASTLILAHRRRHTA